MVNLLLREEVYNDVRATEIPTEELKAYYKTHQDEFTVPEKLQIKRIFLRYGGESDRTLADAKALAEELANKIRRDVTTFGGIAEQYSDDPYKRRGGDLGYVARDGKPNVPTEVIEKAFSMKVGQLSKPFEAGEGINLVLVAARRPAVERTFDQMKGSVLRRLKNEKFQSFTDSYIKRLRAQYDIEIDESALQAVPIESRRSVSGMDPGSILPGVGPRPDRGLPVVPDVEGSDPGKPERPRGGGKARPSGKSGKSSPPSKAGGKAKEAPKAAPKEAPKTETTPAPKVGKAAGAGGAEGGGEADKESKAGKAGGGE